MKFIVVGLTKIAKWILSIPGSCWKWGRSLLHFTPRQQYGIIKRSQSSFHPHNNDVKKPAPRYFSMSHHTHIPSNGTTYHQRSKWNRLYYRNQFILLSLQESLFWKAHHITVGYLFQNQTNTSLRQCVFFSEKNTPIHIDLSTRGTRHINVHKQNLT